jgi:molybdate transport system substrate-binding protein
MKTLLRLATVTALLFTLARPTLAEDAAKPGLLVLAAASLTDVLNELSTTWTRKSGVPVKLSFAASSALARQIEAGSQADVFVSADQEWMDYLAKKGLIHEASRADLVSNRLVLIAPADSKVALAIKPGFDLVGALAGGRLATGDPDTVPVGKYARAALSALGAWDRVADKVASAENVRTALMYVSRGEAPLGIVYATDALVEPGVRIVDTFSQSTHEPITYPGATLKGAKPEAAAYLLFLAGADAAKTWNKFGFLTSGK